MPAFKGLSAGGGASVGKAAGKKKKKLPPVSAAHRIAPVC
eukprot:gene38673-54485_t